jgi:hypothetical protein
MTVEELVRNLIEPGADVASATSTAESWGPLNALLTETGTAKGVDGRMLRLALSSRSRAGSVELGPGRREHDRQSRGRQAKPDLVVCASGNLALVYLTESADRLTLEDLQSRHPRLIEGLARHDGIGFVMVRSAARGGVVLGPNGAHDLETGEIVGDDPLEPFGAGAADDLRRLDGMPNVGDLVLNSRLDPATDEVAAFEELVGSHGGLGGWQTQAFVLHPAEWAAGPDRLVGAPAVHRQLMAWLRSAKPAESAPRPVDEPTGS